MSIISWIRGLNQKDREYECGKKCLDNLSPREHEMVMTLAVYRKDDRVTEIRRRRELAAQLGITYTDLMSELQRIRAKYEDCMRKCMSD